MMLKALVVFALTYCLMIALPRFRPLTACAGALAFLLLKLIPPDRALASIQWNVLLMIGGTMGVVSLFSATGMPARMADRITRLVPDVRWAILALSLLASLVSALVDNVATVLMIAPVAIAVAEKQRINPVPMLIAIAVSSNLQGAATLVGDTTSILMGSEAGMDFLDFFWFRGRLGIFWVVQAGCLAAMGVLLLLFRRERSPVNASRLTPVTDYFPTVLLCAMVILLIAVSFLPEKPENANGWICLDLFVLGLLRELLRGNRAGAARAIREVDWSTLLLLLSLLVVIGGLTYTGVIDALSRTFLALAGRSLFSCYTLIVWFSVLASAFVDNIPYVATMLPVMTAAAAAMGVTPYILYYGLLIGATLGGNLTPIGASANITALGLLEKRGYRVRSGDYLRIGVPFTLAAVATGYGMVWLLWR